MSTQNEYRADYPRSPIGDGNPYYRCACCGKSDPQINGRIDGHYEDCEWRVKQERSAFMDARSVNTGRTPEQRARDIMDQACLSENYVRNGVDAALRKDIADAIRDAVAEARRNMGQGIPEDIDGAEPPSVMGIPVDDPKWDEAGKTHDWRNHVGDNVKALWSTLTTAQRLAIALDAESDADCENWD